VLARAEGMRPHSMGAVVTMLEPAVGAYALLLGVGAPRPDLKRQETC